MAALHVVAGVAYFETDLHDRVLLKLGLAPEPEFTHDFMADTQRLIARDRAAEPHSIIFLGDSHIRRLDLADMPFPSVNLSVAGETSARLLARLPHYRLLRTAPAAVLGVGINDLKFRDAAEFRLNMEQLIRFIPAEVPLIVKDIMPVDEASQALFENEDVQAFNTVLRDLCAHRARCIFVDLAPILEDASGNLAAARHTGDGLHLTPEAENLLKEWMAAGVEQALDNNAATASQLDGGD